MAIKFRPVHTSELHFPVHCHAACPAHSGAVHHNRIQAYYGCYPEFLRHFADKFHHNHRAYSYAHVIMLSLFHQIFDRLRHHTASAIRTIIRGNIKVSGHFRHFFFQNQQILRFCSHDDIRFYSFFLQPLYLGIYGSCAYASCYEKNTFFLQFLQ